MQPEISRRCASCGASIRGGASFCYQCGAALAQARTSGGIEIPEERLRKLESELDRTPTTSSEVEEVVAQGEERDAAAQDSGVAAGAVNDASVGNQREVESSARSRIVAHREKGGRRTKRQRVTQAARGAVEEKLAPRVEKIRQTSAGVLDEAAIDPSLRFVLVAAAIFVLFLILLLLSLTR
jgi:zinc-ribbon domain